MKSRVLAAQNPLEPVMQNLTSWGAPLAVGVVLVIVALGIAMLGLSVRLGHMVFGLGCAGISVGCFWALVVEAHVASFNDDVLLAVEVVGGLGSGVLAVLALRAFIRG